MDGSKARKCITNPDLSGTLEKWNDFVRCSKKIYKDGFCEKCYKKDNRKNTLRIPGQLWERDGIYGEPYGFPYHINERDKKWVEKIYILHPEIRPQKEKDNDYELKQQAVKDWLDKYSTKIDYKMGKELEKIINKK